MTTTDYQIQDLFDAIHGLTPASLTLDQLARVLSAVRFAAFDYQDEIQRRERAIARRREMGVAA